MSVSQSNMEEKTGRTPSLFVSLIVLGVMIALIVLSVVIFGDEVGEGPLQVCMTLATLFALFVAYLYGFRGSLINQAISSGIRGVIGTIFVLLAIGSLISTLYLTGTMASIVFYGVNILNAKFYYVITFILALGLSMLLGSTLTAIGAVGVAFIGLASVMGVSPDITAGAAVSGAIIGDKTARVSDTFALTIDSVGGIKASEHARTVMKTAAPTVLISAVIFLVLGLIGDIAGESYVPTDVRGMITQYFNVSLWTFIPIILIVVLSVLHFSAYMSLTLAAISAVILAIFTQRDLVLSVAADPGLSYFQAAFKVGISTIATGFHLNSGVAALDRVFSGGGAIKMLTTVWLLLIATSFGAVVDYTGMLQRVITPVINIAKGPVRLILITILTSMGLNIVTADPYISIGLSARMFRQHYINKRLKPVVLSATLADSGSIFSYLIPWNVHGALLVATLGIGTATWALYGFTGYLTPLVTFVIACIYFRKNRFPDKVDVAQAYGEGIGKSSDITHLA